MKYGLIGEKLGHSYSVQIHKLFGNDEYVLKEIAENELADFFQKKDFLGINVTIPYKEKSLKYLDFVDEKAKEIGAVNTVVNRDGTIYGYNTDYYGLKYLLEKNGISVLGKKVAVLGSGGASKTAVVLLKDLGAKSVIIVSRSGRYNYENQKEYCDVEVMINASPVGMYPNNGECLIDVEIFEKLQAFVDLIYNPFVTELAFRCTEKNIKSVNGLGMLVAQAHKASEIFFDKTIEENEIVAVQEKIKKLLLNVVLVGMPGSGKSSLARQLALKLNKEFVDLDEEIEKTYKISPSKYIIDYGEEKFRQTESEVLSNVCKKSGLIIATGGGAILKKENRKAIKSNGRCVYVKRSLEKLPTDGRPLSKNGDVLKEMFSKREPLYLEVADYIIDNDASIEETLNEIIKVIG